MKLLTIITVLFLGTSSFSQDKGIIKLVFSDKSNFDLITRNHYKIPAIYFVLNKTDEWNTYRFHVDEDLKSDSVRKELERDEHSRYNSTYLFTDSSLNKLFSETQKQYLFNHAQSIKPRQLIDTFQVFKLINSFNTAKNGFFFSVTDPIFTQDKQYAFVDMIIYKKEKDTENLNTSYFGITLLIYQNIKGKGWTRIKKINRLIL